MNECTKAEYASIVFFIISLALIKWSISTFIQQLSRSTTHRRLDWVLQGIIGLWVLTSVLVSLFQCALPTPWDYVHGARCVDRVCFLSFRPVLVENANRHSEPGGHTSRF